MTTTTDTPRKGRGGPRPGPGETMKQQINFRASSLTARQLETLAARWGTTVTEAITVIVDRAYREEVLMDLDPNGPENV